MCRAGAGMTQRPFRPGPAARRGSGSTSPSSRSTRRRSAMRADHPPADARVRGAGSRSAAGAGRRGGRPRSAQPVGQAWQGAGRPVPVRSRCGRRARPPARPSDHTRDGPAFHPLPRPFGTPPAALRLRRVHHRHPAAGASPMQTPTPTATRPRPPPPPPTRTSGRASCCARSWSASRSCSTRVSARPPRRRCAACSTGPAPSWPPRSPSAPPCRSWPARWRGSSPAGRTSGSCRRAR